MLTIVFTDMGSEPPSIARPDFRVDGIGDTTGTSGWHVVLPRPGFELALVLNCKARFAAVDGQPPAEPSLHFDFGKRTNLLAHKRFLSWSPLS
jgi:hypothetical protein